MQYPVKDFVVGGRVRCKTECLLAPVVPQQRIGENIVVPGADAGGVRREPQPLLARTQLLLNAHLRRQVDVLENDVRDFPRTVAHRKEMPLRPENSSLSRRCNSRDVVANGRRYDSIAVERAPNLRNYTLLLELGIGKN